MGSKKKLTFVTGFILSLLLVAFSYLFITKNQPQLEIPIYHMGEKISLGISVVDLKGKKWEFKDFHKNLTLVNFWASWCGPCRDELPALGSLETKFHDKGFRVFSLVMEEDYENSQKILEQIHGDKNQFILLSGLDSDLARSFSFSGIPYSVLIDKNGIVKKIWQGEVNWLNSEIVKFMESLL